MLKGQFLPLLIGTKE